MEGPALEVTMRVVLSLELNILHSHRLVREEQMIRQEEIQVVTRKVSHLSTLLMLNSRTAVNMRLNLKLIITTTHLVNNNRLVVGIRTHL